MTTNLVNALGRNRSCVYVYCLFPFSDFCWLSVSCFDRHSSVFIRTFEIVFVILTPFWDLLIQLHCLIYPQHEWRMPNFHWMCIDPHPFSIFPLATVIAFHIFTRLSALSVLQEPKRFLTMLSFDPSIPMMNIRISNYWLGKKCIRLVISMLMS